METPGMLLRREREVRGLSLKGISEVTRIPVSSLEAIENNDFESLPAEVFVKGFLRNYARELQISTEEVMHAYNIMHAQKARLNHYSVEMQSVMPEAPHFENDDVEMTSTLVLGATEDKRVAPAQAVNTDSVSHSFRFAYILAALITVACITCSVVFTGIGEAEESDIMYEDDVVEEEDSAYLISNTSVVGWGAQDTE